MVLSLTHKAPMLAQSWHRHDQFLSYYNLKIYRISVVLDHFTQTGSEQQEGDDETWIKSTSDQCPYEFCTVGDKCGTSHQCHNTVKISTTIQIIACFCILFGVIYIIYCIVSCFKKSYKNLDDNGAIEDNIDDDFFYHKNDEPIKEAGQK